MTTERDAEKEHEKDKQHDQQHRPEEHGRHVKPHRSSAQVFGRGLRQATKQS